MDVVLILMFYLNGLLHFKYGRNERHTTNYRRGFQKMPSGFLCFLHGSVFETGNIHIGVVDVQISSIKLVIAENITPVRKIRNLT